MVVAARRAYADAIRWIKRARPPGLDPWRLTRRVFRFTFAASFMVLGLIGVSSPDRFGSPHMKPMGSLQWWALSVVVGICVAVAATRWAKVKRVVDLLVEPLRRPLADLSSFEPAVGALQSCPAAFRTRFTLGWVWGPAAAVVAACFFLASSAYFIVDAILARFQVGWQPPVLAAVNALLALALLRAVARRLATWRLALSVHREVAGRYDD